MHKQNSRLQGLDAKAVRHVVAAAEALEAGRADHAASALAIVVADHAEHPEIQRLNAGLLSLRGRHAEAVHAIRYAVQKCPSDFLYLNTLATVLAGAGDLDGAIEVLRDVCRQQPDLAIAWYNLGILLTRSVRYRDATTALQRAVELSPANAPARAQLADLLRMNDRSDEAIRQYRTLLAEQPWSGIAWWGLADVKTVAMTADDCASIRRALHDPRAGDDDRIAMGFALAKALDDQGLYAQSLEALADANAIARRRRTWNANAFDAMIAQILAARPESSVDGSADPAEIGSEVIFVVGVPRSGTTLVEQILASHSRVEGAGELPDLAVVIGEESRRRGLPFQQWLSTAQPSDWKRLGADYLERTRRWRLKAPVFVDKMPTNWVYGAAIAHMLPGAHVVFCRRDPVETCLSCYRQLLPGNEYSRSFRDLADYWRLYEHTMLQLTQRHPARAYEHDYEALIEAPEARIRSLLAFCALPFEAACLDFHATRREVGSPSAMQVRQPLRRDTARAARYGALLDPLRDALGLQRYAMETP